MFQRALICTDFEDGLYRLARVLPSFLAAGMTHVTFLHNISVPEERAVPRMDPDQVEGARQYLQGFLGEMPSGLTVEVEITVGRPSDSILRLAKKVDVVLLGMPARSLLSEKLFGSTTMGLLERTPVPLLILRPQMLAIYTQEELALRCRHLFHRLLVPYNHSDSAQALLASLQRVFDCTAMAPESCPLKSYLLAWVVTDGMRQELRDGRALRQAEEILVQVGATLTLPGGSVETVIRQGDALAEILRLAELEDISAIAAGPSSGSGLIRWSVPSLTRELIRRSWHPVLYLPQTPSS